MAWKDTLLDAKYRGIVFDCQVWDDEAEISAVEHTRPYVDGAQMEDMGRGARKLKVKAIFFGNDYEARLQAFMKALEEPGVGELVHPVFGPVKAQRLTWHIGHEADSVDAASVELAFAESNLAKPLFERSLPGQKAAEILDKSEAARTGAGGVLGDEAAKSKNPLALAKASLEAVRGLKMQSRDYITSGVDAVSAPGGWARDVAGLVSGIVDLRGFDAASLMSDYMSISRLLTTAILLPGFDFSSSSSSSSSGGSSGGSSLTTDLTPGREADVVQAHVEMESALGKAEAAQVVLAAEAETPTLSPPEIEAVAADTRTSIEGSITAYRQLYPIEQSRRVTEPLKDVALAVQDSAKAIIEARPPLVDRQVENPACLRLLAHRWYGDHTRAPELLRLNRPMRDPNFLTSGEVLRGYAN
jgi:prophage DNA circulation protein